MKTGYCITTKQFTLRCNHPEWLMETQNLYNEVLLFYYQLLLKHPQLHALNNQQILRELEILSVPGRDKLPVPYPLFGEEGRPEAFRENCSSDEAVFKRRRKTGKIPLYFRRSAINSATAMVKSYLARQEQEEPTQKFQKPVTFYKGMYRDLTEKQIELKVWNGEKWIWLHCRLGGNRLPTEGELLSPTVTAGEKGYFLNVPVRGEVSDSRKAIERIAHGSKMCCVKFSNQDALAVCAVLDGEGKLITSYYIKGGNQYRHLCSGLIEKMEKSKKSIGDQKENQPNKRYWVKLKNVSDYFSNSVSRQIIDISTKENADIIALAKYDKEYSINVLGNTGKWSPLSLSTRIRDQLKYKAWSQGILVLEVNCKDIANRCSRCGAPIKTHGTEYFCENGHQGERHLNSAIVMGRKCRESFQHYKKETSSR